MNFLIGAIGAHLTLGLVTSVTSSINGVYTLSSNIVNSTSSGAKEIKQIIVETDLEVKINHVHMFLKELKLTSSTPYNIQYYLHAINDAINDIAQELEKIHYRMQYNDNLWIGSSVRSYKFHNCKIRLQSKLKHLEDRLNTLISLLSIQDKMIKNPELEKDMSQSILQVAEIDSQIGKKAREAIHDRLDFINK